MSAQEIDKGAVQSRVVLVVPKQHVKTVKSALERFDQFDRSSKIIPEPQAESPAHTDTTSEQNNHATRSHPREGINAAVPGATHQQDSSVQQQRFPVLKFDVVSGEYVDPSVLEDSTRIHGLNEPQSSTSTSVSSGGPDVQNTFPTLRFDVDSGRYVESSTLMRQDQNGAILSQDPRAETAFSALQFDAASGQYVGDSGLQKRGQQSGEMHGEQRSTTELPSTRNTRGSTTFPRLGFDVISGEYVDQSDQEKGDRSIGEAGQQRMRIPTTIPYRSTIGTNGIADDEDAYDLKTEMLGHLDLGHILLGISVSYHLPSIELDGSPVSKSPVHVALRKALNALPDSTLSSLGLTPETLVASFPDGYSVYKPMLLLSHNAFSSDAWNKLLASQSGKQLQQVWQSIAEPVGATHVAINSPIPLQCITTSTEAASHENILRSPSNLTPLYGDFGPALTPQTLSSPTAANFGAALWVTTKQNGIHQTWAPQYTMFSRGNIREKTRILQHPSVARDFDVPSAAVDLYVGIGYFAFSYKKSAEGRQNGIKRVICWEINPWSVEGLRRGAEMNGWTCRIIKPEDIEDLHGEDNQEPTYDEDFTVFQMSNKDADCGYAAMKGSLLKLPIRHVNLGLLPYSRLSWGTAIDMIDTERGGWIHAHENVSVKDIEERTKKVEAEFQRLLDKRDGRLDMRKEQENRMQRRVRVEHVEKVKMYAPGVMHCVFDIAVKGM